ncbi:helix-turn-helix domain-containing protein [Actinomadura rupiterrae]|uniref:helix-turn-helix domain-containing protein n=1 Tax=Actinomadura rupiterrae TaxID=559627 RepID=UPI0020A3ED0E|nr:helix-turn-helix domain-containing protein [Actinomadura rupiterrae]MCP2335120.1 excisionase family DNA binding protein [Actinomadura rupiterrae]
MTIGTPKRLEPGQVDAEDAARAMRRIRDYLMRHPGAANVDLASKLSGDGPLIVPRDVLVLFASILAQLAQGRGVTLVPIHAELTTREAADMLNVSHSHLIGLIDSGRLPARPAGRHRKIAFKDLMAYRRESDAESAQAMDDLVELSEEMGLYE